MKGFNSNSNQIIIGTAVRVVEVVMVDKVAMVDKLGRAVVVMGCSNKMGVVVALVLKIAEDIAAEAALVLKITEDMEVEVVVPKMAGIAVEVAVLVPLKIIADMVKDNMVSRTMVVMAAVKGVIMVVRINNNKTTNMKTNLPTKGTWVVEEAAVRRKRHQRKTTTTQMQHLNLL